MQVLPKSVERLIGQFSQLPGIGPKTASRLVFYLLRNPRVDLSAFGEAVANLKNDLGYCAICHNIADQAALGEMAECVICRDTSRDKSLLCVVEEPLDVVALEKAGFSGVYHVLGGQISPLDGIGPSDLSIDSLINRLREDKNVTEVILATNPNVEGEATASYLTKVLGEFDIKISRIARGLPMGGDLEYADELTLSRALEGRNTLTAYAK